MNNIYDEESQSQIEDLNIEADHVIAMNPSGIIEKFTEDVTNKKIHCDGNKCVILGDNEEVSNNIKNSGYVTYITYFIIFVILCILAYFLYNKYYCKS